MKQPTEPETLHAAAIAAQERFDAMAAEHETSGDQQIKLRLEMLQHLVTIETCTTNAIEAEDMGDNAAARAERAINLETVMRFDAAALEYARLRTADLGRLRPLRDALAEFMRLRARLSALGYAASETIKHENVAKALESHAFKAASPEHN